MNSVYIDSAIAATPIYIGPTNASSVVIGNTNCSTIVNGSLVMGTGKNITLQPSASYVAPTSITQLGYLTNGSAIGSYTWSNNSRVQISNIPITQAGTYIVMGSVFLTFASTTGLTNLDIRISTDNTGTSPNTVTLVYQTWTGGTTINGEVSYQMSGIYTTTVTTTTLYFNGIATFTGGGVSNQGSAYPQFFKAVRIA